MHAPRSIASSTVAHPQSASPRAGSYSAGDGKNIDGVEGDCKSGKPGYQEPARENSGMSLQASARH